MAKKKLSFVIPVYNVEKYLKECINSILNQCDETCEIILVDDGSTDSSGKICDDYSLNNSIVKTIHKKNGGLSSARNLGMEHVNSLYIAFVDSDDRISDNSINKILRWIDTERADICFMKAIKFFPDGRTESLGDEIQSDAIRNQAKENIIKHISSRPKFPGSACTKIFNTEFLRENNLMFPADNRFSEDLGFCLDAILKAKNYDALEIPYYEYRQNRVGSITNSFSEKKYWDLSLFVSESIEKLTYKAVPKGEVEKYMLSNVAYEYAILCWEMSFLTGKNKEKALNYLNDKKWVLKFGLSKKLKGIYILCCIFGVRITSIVLNLYKRIR